MKRQLRNLIIILTAALFFTACEKDETPEVFDTISGVLSAGENVSIEDFNSISIILGKIIGETAPEQASFDTGNLEYISSTEVNTRGNFTFSNLENGNYILLPSNGFEFDSNTSWNAVIDGKTVNEINTIVTRTEAENAELVHYTDPSPIDYTYEYIKGNRIAYEFRVYQKFTSNLAGAKIEKLFIKPIGENEDILYTIVPTYNYYDKSLEQNYSTFTVELGDKYTYEVWIEYSYGPIPWLTKKFSFKWKNTGKANPDQWWNEKLVSDYPLKNKKVFSYYKCYDKEDRDFQLTNYSSFFFQDSKMANDE